MITSVYFENLRTLRRYSLSLRPFNVLVGPNNSGKSTVLDAFRLLVGVYRYASRYNPSWIALPDGRSTYGYSIPDGSIAINTENLRTDYEDVPVSVRFRFDKGQSLHVTVPVEGQVLLHFDTPRSSPRSATAFRKEFPVSILPIPTLGPLEQTEELAQADYVARWSVSHRAPRLLRNAWYHDSTDFDRFQKLLERTWPGSTINQPEFAKGFSKRLVMFCNEGRIPREVYWTGYGFQIWLQLLTQIIRGSNAELIVVDEPEIYLHPDLQRQLVGILKEAGPKILMATHSVEIINEVEPEDVLLVEKGARTARRMTDLKGLQRAANSLDSAQNIHLTRLARGRRVLFVEGQDQRILHRLASRVGFQDLFTGGDITVLPIGGFSQWQRVAHANWALTEVLGEQVRLSALFDRDYRCEEEISEFLDKLRQQVPLIHVWTLAKIDLVEEKSWA